MAKYNRKKADESILREMYEVQLMTHPQIAQALGVSERSVRRWMSTYDIKGRLYIGEDNPRYTTGRTLGRARYRKARKIEACDLCQGTDNLCVHHVDFDHYNNHPDNLQILCLSCHMSLHKQQYWDSVKQGQRPKRSNAPAGWTRQK